MKVKASWVAFVPLTVGAVLLHIYHLIFIGGDEITQPLFGDYSLLINRKTEPEMIVILAAVLFAFAMLFNLIDRKTSPYCEIKSDPLSGIFLILSGLMLGVDSAVSLMTNVGGTEPVNSFWLLNALGIVTALIFAIVGMGLLVGFNIAKKIRIFMLVPTIWSAVCLVSIFYSHRKEAPSFAFFDVFAWAFMTLFIFENSMVLCGIEIKNPVKDSFVYGMTFVLFSFVYSISAIRESIQEAGSFDITRLMSKFYIAALGLYALFSLFKLSSAMMTKEKAAEYIDGRDETDDDYDEEEEDDEVPEAAFGVGSTKFVTAEFEKIRLEKAAKKAKERNTGVIPSVVAENEDDEDFESDEEDEPMSTLDKIDQLIMELSDDSED